MLKRICCAILVILILFSISACVDSNNYETTESEETNKPVYTIGAYYTTKRDKVYIYFDDAEKKLYWTSKRSSAVSVYSYTGSILDVENGIIDENEHVYKKVGGDIKKYTLDGRELSSYSICAHNETTSVFDNKDIR